MLVWGSAARIVHVSGRSKRKTMGVKAVDAILFRCQEDFVMFTKGHFAGGADRHRAKAISFDMKICLGPKMFGDLDCCSDIAAISADRQMFGTDANFMAVMFCCKLPAQEVHFR